MRRHRTITAFSRNYYVRVLRRCASSSIAQHKVSVPQNHWKEQAHHREFFESLAKKLKLYSFDDWYKITSDVIKRNGGAGLLNLYGGSLIVALSKVYPEKEWHPWRFNKVPKGFWDEPSNQRKYFDWLAKQLNITHMDQWYSVKTSDIDTNVFYYHESIGKALASVYPDHKWLMWKFNQVPKNFWMDKDNQRNFLEWLAKELNFNSMEDWYELRVSDVTSRGGHGLLNHYNSSIVKALLTLYPDYSWQLWRFSQVPKDFWKDKTNLVQYVQWLSEKLGIRHLEDWHYVSHQQIPKYHSLFKIHGGIIPVLAQVYPDYDWKCDKEQPSAVRSKGQFFLFKTLQELFPDRLVLMDFKHATLNFPQTNRPLELDVFVPDLSLGFEYQGERHYMYHYLSGDPEQQKQRDEQKRGLCRKHNITVIEIPFWWNRKKQSLLATIACQRPDLHIADGINIESKIPSYEEWKLVSNRKQQPKHQEETFKHAYSVDVGGKMGVPACKGCGKRLRERNQLRIIVKGAFTPTSWTQQGKSHPARYSVCLDNACLQKAIKRYRGFSNPMIHFPEFKELVVPSHLKQQFEKDQKDLGGLFVVQ